jgi:hypothetical protein
MDKKVTLSIASIALFFMFSFNIKAQSNIKYGPNYIAIEAEDTGNTIEKWVIRKPGDQKYLDNFDGISGAPGPINDTYIEYTGGFGNKDQGNLTYTFTAPKTAKYQMTMRMYSPIGVDDKADKKNDVFVKMEGDFTSGSAKWSNNDLGTLNKFFGRGKRYWGNCSRLEHNGFDYVFYNLKKGEQYTFTLNGRSAGTSIDYIVFFDTTITIDTSDGFARYKDPALSLPEEIRPNNSSLSVTEISTTNFKMYPNPANETVYIKMNNSFKGNLKITISNISGQTIYNQKINDTNKNIDVSLFTTGFYFVKITEGNSVTTKKLIIK